MKTKITLLLTLIIFMGELSSQILVEKTVGTSSNQVKIESLINTDQYVLQSNIDGQKVFVKETPRSAANRPDNIELEINLNFDPEVYFPRTVVLYNETGGVYSTSVRGVNSVVINIPEGQYDILLYSGTQAANTDLYLIKEQIEVQANVPLTLTPSEAQNFIQMSFLDDEGETLKPEPFGNGVRAIPSFTQSFAFNPTDMVIFNSMTFWVSQGSSDAQMWDFYINDVSERYSFFHAYNAVRHDGMFFASQFESANGFDSSASYQNDPNDYIFHQEKFQPSVAGNAAGNYLKGFKTNVSWNGKMVGGFALLDESHEIDLEQGVPIYLDNHLREGSAKFEIAPSLADYVEEKTLMITGNPILLGNPGDIKYGSGATAIASGRNFHMADGWAMTLPFNPQFTFNTSQNLDMIQGNNVPILNVFSGNHILAGTKRTGIVVQSIGRYGEVRESDLKEIAVEILHDGDSVYTGDVSGLLAFQILWRMGGHPDGIFEITMTSTNTEVDGISGFTQTKVSSDWTKEDWTAPVITRMQFRDTSGQVIDRFESAQDGTVRITAGDFEYDSTLGSFNYQEGNQVEFFYSKNGEDEWAELELTEYPEHFFMPGFGDYYEASLEDIQQIENEVWYDVKLISTDAAGNTLTQMVSPAFFIENSNLGVQDAFQPEIMMFPNPFSSNLIIKGLPEEMQSGFRFTVTDLLGRLIHSEDVIAHKNQFVWEATSLATGTYIVKITNGRTSFTQKIIKK